MNDIDSLITAFKNIGNEISYKKYVNLQIIKKKYITFFWLVWQGGEIMPNEIADARREEIIDACEELYKKLDFKDINIKLIGEQTSFGRTSIYNYFQTKEEIFLALVEREYLEWNDDLAIIYEQNYVLTKREFIGKITDSLLKRKTLLKLISMNMFEMEANSSVESIINFKRAFKQTIALLEICFCKFLKINESRAEEITFTFLPFLTGVYFYTSITPKQIQAIKETNLQYRFYTEKELIKMGLERILGGIKCK